MKTELCGCDLQLTGMRHYCGDANVLQARLFEKYPETEGTP